MKNLKFFFGLVLLGIFILAGCGGANNTTQNTNDKDKFIGAYTWNGNCPRGCFTAYTFKQNGTFEMQSENSLAKHDTTGNWTIDENSKVISMNGVNSFYKFSNDTLILTDCQYKIEMKLAREK